MSAILSSPAVAIALGLVAGVLLLFLPFGASRYFSPNMSQVCIFVATGGVILGLVLGFGIMFAYHSVSPGGFVYFGFAIVCGFLLALVPTGAILLRRMMEADEQRS